MSIDIASPGANKPAIHDALRDIVGWLNVDQSGADSADPVWDQPVDGSVANVDIVNRDGVQDIVLIARLVTLATSGILQVRASVNKPRCC